MIKINLKKINFSERQRKVQVPENIHENRILLFKEWCKAKRKEWQSDIMLINRLIYSQQEALNELRSESEELYQAAVKV